MTDANVKRSSDGQISAYAAMGPRQPLKPYQYTPKALGPSDVEVAISHCGICHTDIHLLDDNPRGWPSSRWSPDTRSWGWSPSAAAV